jgi:hypothetical protein
LATNPALAAEYDRCKRAGGSNTSYVCCVNPLEACNRSGGLLLNAANAFDPATQSACPKGTTLVFGPIKERVCCKKIR